MQLSDISWLLMTTTVEIMHYQGFTHSTHAVIIQHHQNISGATRLRGCRCLDLGEL